MIAEDLRNKFKEETGIPWENSQREPDIDYVTWLETKVLSYQLHDPYSPHILSDKQKESLEKAKNEWKTDKKLLALTIVRQVYPILNLERSIEYCEKHFN